MKDMIMNKRLAAGLVAGFILSATAQAAVSGSSTAGDKRIQYSDYNPDNVVNIYAKPGRAVLVQLAEGESLNGSNAGLGMGDAQAWHLTVRGNNIFFKPAAQSPQTNMVLTSNQQRSYAFDLRVAAKKQPPTYIMRFRYPAEEGKAAAARQQKAAQAAAMLKLYERSNGTEPGENRNYSGRGDKALAPTAAWDNGRFTYLRFNNSKSLPAIFKINADGSEALVNSHIEGDTVVIHETAAHFVLRLGRSVLGIDNLSHQDGADFNWRNATETGTIRMNKGQ